MELIKSKRLTIYEKNGTYYIYNHIFGNLTQADNDLVSLLESFSEAKEANLENPIISELHQKKFLLEPGKNEYDILNAGSPKFKETLRSGGLIRKLQLMVTKRCNLACDYCYEERTGPKTEILDMDFETAKKAIDGFFEIVNKHNQKKVFIRYFGGEPLVNWDLIKKCSEYIKTIDTASEVIQCINTNGTLITEDIAAHMSEHDFDIDLSLDAPDETNDKYRVFKGCLRKGTFKSIDNALDILQKYGANVEVSAQLNDINIDKLPKFVDYVKAKGHKNLELNTLMCDDLALSKSDLQKRINALINLRKYASEQGIVVAGKWIRLYNHTLDGTLNYCSRCGEQISVEPSGKLFPCSGVSVELGHVNNMRQVFTNANYERLSMRIVGQIPGCQGCSIEGMCAGGCVANAEFVAKSDDVYTKEASECAFRQSIVKAQIGMDVKPEDPAYKSLIKNHF